MILYYINWDVNPELIRISENFAIRWYGLLFASGFLVGYFIMAAFFRKENITPKLLDTLTTYMVIATVIGARLGHCLFYEPLDYLKNPITILYIWEGGLASHGAAVGILIALYIFSRKNKKSYLWVLDRIVIVVALAGAFIRTGNLVNSEIYGHETSLPWGFIFVRANEVIPRHPTQIYEALAYLGIFAFLLSYYYKHNGKPKEGMIFGIFLVTLFTARFLIEFLKEVQVDFESSLPLNLGQLLSIPFIITGVLIIFAKREKSIKENNL